MSKKALLILGGLRIGDCWHVIPILNKLRNQGYQIHWVSGTYEKAVVEELSNIYECSYKLYDDGFPTDINSRYKFAEKYGGQYEPKDYDLVFEDYKSTFEFEPNWEVKPEEMTLPNRVLFPMHGIQDQIVVQADSISASKRIPALFNVTFPMKVISVGAANERIIQGSESMLGKPWHDVLNKIAESKLYVGIHSACTCLAFYTRTPMIVLDFGKQFDFSRFQTKPIWQLFNKPDATSIQNAVSHALSLQSR